MSQAELGVFYEGCMTSRADKDIYRHSCSSIHDGVHGYDYAAL